jgi:hypothetical protein
VLDEGVQLVSANASEVLVRLHWRDPESQGPGGLWQLVTMRDGRIVDIQDYRNSRRAQRAMR